MTTDPNSTDPGSTDVKHELHLKLDVSRTAMLAAVKGLGERDLRRPMTTTGTNLLGLVKHLIGIEHVYLGHAFGRPPPDVLPWVEDGSVWDGADMWATADEASDGLVALYRRACAHGDETIDALDLQAAGSVLHWPEERRTTTLAVLLVRMVDETARHAGHADILRELVDGRAGSDRDEVMDRAGWRAYVARIQGVADNFAR